MYAIETFCSVKIELSDFRLSTQVLSNRLPHKGFCLCCDYLPLQIRLEPLFILNSGIERFYFFFRFKWVLLEDFWLSCLVIDFFVV